MVGLDSLVGRLVGVADLIAGWLVFLTGWLAWMAGCVS
jgi:hypothetical protein